MSDWLLHQRMTSRPLFHFAQLSQAVRPLEEEKALVDSLVKEAVDLFNASPHSDLELQIKVLPPPLPSRSQLIRRGPQRVPVVEFEVKRLPDPARIDHQARLQSQRKKTQMAEPPAEAAESASGSSSRSSLSSLVSSARAGFGRLVGRR